MFDEKDLETLKIVIIGESGVGKTSIISQFIDQIFQKDQQSTIGGTFSTKTIKCGNGKILKLEIWDTAGLGKNVIVVLQKCFIKMQTPQY